jgi:long-subunit fatty acid transport protein
MKMIKNSIGVVLLFAATFSYSQENTSSPYSYYGIGEVKFKGTNENRAMGGLSVVSDSIHLNLMNPASYSKLKSTTFTVGGTTNFNKLHTSNESEKAQRTSFDYLAVAFPVGKFGLAFGLMPLTAVGYKIQNFTDSNSRYTQFLGTGNLNRAFIGASYKFNQNFSLGVDLDYYFGNLETKNLEFIRNSIIIIGSREINSSNIRGTSFNFGMYYERKLKENLELYSSFTFSPEAKLSAKNSRTIATVFYSASGDEIPTDLIDVKIANTSPIIPSKVSFGAGIGKSKKWMFGSEVTFIENSKQISRFGNEVGTNYKFENSTRVSVGGFYIPKSDSFTSYLSRMVYRAGLRYENIGLLVNDKSINDFGMNFGIGLPVGAANINLGFEYGKRGSTSNGLIKEDYFNISVGLSLNEIWFSKRKID